jgi:hypothetical protein
VVAVRQEAELLRKVARLKSQDPKVQQAVGREARAVLADAAALT